METSSDFTTTLISNGSEKYHLDNTLTQFTNELPNEIILDGKKDWFVSLQDCGIHLNYENLSFPKNSPVLITFDGNDLVKNLGPALDNVTALSPEIHGYDVILLAYEKLILNTLPGFNIVTEELKLIPQLFTLDSIKAHLDQFISNSDFLKDYLKFDITTNIKKYNAEDIISEEEKISVKGLDKFLINNPSVEEVKLRQVRFKNLSSNNIIEKKIKLNVRWDYAYINYFGMH